MHKDTAVKATKRTLQQGKAVVRAIEALETIQRTGAIESAITWLVLKGYRRRRRTSVARRPRAPHACGSWPLMYTEDQQEKKNLGAVAEPEV